MLAEMDYKERDIKQLRKWFSSKKKDQNDFRDFDEFYRWYQKQKKKCVYCDLAEEQSYYIVRNGLLKSKRFSNNGEIIRGRARGLWLEVDRLDPEKKYSETNCGLCCYFCNNDKSDIFDDREYRLFRKNREEYLVDLINNRK